MNFTKVVFLAVLVTISTATPADRNDHSDLIHELHEKVDALLHLRRGPIVEALETLKELHNAVHKLGEDHLHQAEDEIMKAAQPAVDFIAELQQTRDPPLQCLGNAGQDLRKALDGARSRVRQAVSDRTHQIQAVINQELEVFRRFVENINTVGMKLPKCLRPLPSLRCLQNLGEETAGLVTEITSELNRIITDIEHQVETLPAHLRGVVGGVVAETRQEVRTLMTELRNCILGGSGVSSNEVEKELIAKFFRF